MQRWRLQQSPRLVLALCAAAAVAWVLVQLSDAQQSPAPSSREPLVCPAVGSQPAAQLKTEMKARLASKPGDAPAAYHCYAKALTEAHCRDLGPLNLDPQVKIKALADKSILVKIDPLPVYLNVYNGSQDIVSGHLVKGEGWEQYDIDQVVWALRQSTASTLRSVLRPLSPPPPPPVFLDIGANVGAFTMQVAARGFSVMSFEAMPDNQKLLRTAMCASHPDIRTRVTVHSFGLGAEPTTCYIMSADSNRGDGVSVCGVKSEAEARERTHGNYHLRGAFDVLRGDDVLQGQHIQVMKIDVEGHEPFVFQGMKKIIKQQKIKYILMEYNKAMLPDPDLGKRKYEYVQEIMKHGYKVSRHSFRGSFMKTRDLPSLDQVTITNLYLVHRSVAGMFA